ncbi:L,D-transpeptidase [Sphingomonas sp. DOAB1063]|uniref:L,D-transpeptidase n=1 Tax=Sphingomonas albertensis TaxID=2762591 RepID=A0ABR7AL47_9SPHN|nr:L,D-transpeptidase [Sphingomonas albertensis]
MKVIGRDRVGRRWRGTLITGLAALAATSPGVAQAVRAEPIGRFGTEAVSNDARDTADWVAASHDNQGLPFIVIDKVNAVVFAFDATGRLRGTAPALLGMARGDASVPGIGQRKLATITPAERTTPAGRFKASLGHDFEQDILWIDYDAALSMHRVIKGRRVDDRAGRLASPTPSDNRISYGCVNVPPGFYDGVVKPLFTGTVGIVYILPETKPLRSVFAVPD